MNVSTLYNGEIVISQKKERAPLVSPILATCLVCFILPFYTSKVNCSVLEKNFSSFSLTKLLRIQFQLVYFCKGIPGLGQHVMRYALTCPRLWRTVPARVYQALYFDSTAMLTVRIRGLGTTANISWPLCKHSQLWRICTDIHVWVEFAFFSRNKSDKKDNLSCQSLIITSSSNATVTEILRHTVTLFVTLVRIHTGSC